MFRCPECSSTHIETVKSPDGEMICEDCGFYVEDKSVQPNPFYVEDEPPAAPEQPLTPGLGEQMYNLYKSKRRKKKKST
jgi:transcription initiation factor TFIIIB Brf1 subunit/transcription initiation factor TFIIB